MEEPKTCAYVWAVLIGFNAGKKNSADYDLLFTAHS